MGGKAPFALLVSLLGFGCRLNFGGPGAGSAGSSSPVPVAPVVPTWIVVADSARLAPTNLDGQPWCETGSLAVELDVTLRHVHSETSLAAGPDPRWDAALFDASAVDIRSG